jgi:integrase
MPWRGLALLSGAQQIRFPKVATIPYFPMVKEENARQGFLTDEQYVTLRDALPDELKPLFVTAYFTGVRLGELLAWEWEQVDFEQGFITLRSEATKNGHSRAVPILEGD